MFNKLKPYLLSIAVYLTLGLVLYTADVTILTWQYWAIVLLAIIGNYELNRIEFSKSWHEQMEMCDKCPFHKKVMEDAIARQLEGPTFKPPFSAQSAPEGTSQHDPKPPQS